jgi:hypothetical protein
MNSQQRQRNGVISPWADPPGHVLKIAFDGYPISTDCVSIKGNLQHLPWRNSSW